MLSSYSEACIIKFSFAKRGENTFQNRHRSLCVDCWYNGNMQRRYLISGANQTGLVPYSEQADGGSLCICTAKDGHLCLKCKDFQNSTAISDADQCFGLRCTNRASEGDYTEMGGKICVWCSRPLPLQYTLSRNRAESRRNYDSRHILARSRSSYERPSKEEQQQEEEDELNMQKVLELDALSRKKEVKDHQQVSSAGTSVTENLINDGESSRISELS